MDFLSIVDFGLILRGELVALRKRAFCVYTAPGSLFHFLWQGNSKKGCKLLSASSLWDLNIAPIKGI